MATYGEGDKLGFQAACIAAGGQWFYTEGYWQAALNVEVPTDGMEAWLTLGSIINSYVPPPE